MPNTGQRVVVDGHRQVVRFGCTRLRDISFDGGSR